MAALARRAAGFRNEQGQRPVIAVSMQMAGADAGYGFPASTHESEPAMVYAMQSGPNTHEGDLIDRAAGGDHAAFRELVRRHEATVAGTVFGMLGRCEEAEDIGQETMVRLYRSLGRFRGEASLKTYVTRIAINLCLDALRRRKRRAWQFWRSDEDGEADIVDPRDSSRDVERRQAIERALDTLTPEFKSVVVMRLVQGFSTEEVAEMLEIPAGTVLSRLARAKKQLASELEELIDV